MCQIETWHGLVNKLKHSSEIRTDTSVFFTTDTLIFLPMQTPCNVMKSILNLTYYFRFIHLEWCNLKCKEEVPPLKTIAFSILCGLFYTFLLYSPYVCAYMCVYWYNFVLLNLENEIYIVDDNVRRRSQWNSHNNPHASQHSKSYLEVCH